MTERERERKREFLFSYGRSSTSENQSNRTSITRRMAPRAIPNRFGLVGGSEAFELEKESRHYAT